MPYCLQRNPDVLLWIVDGKHCKVFPIRKRFIFPLQVVPVVLLVLQFIRSVTSRTYKKDLQDDSNLNCGSVADITANSQPPDPTVDPCSGSLSCHYSLISVASLSMGRGIWEEGMKAYNMICSHCLASLGFTWAERGIGEKHNSMIDL